MFFGTGAAMLAVERRYRAVRAFLPSVAVWFAVLDVGALFHLDDFTRPLPALPGGVRYLSTGVDGTGIKVSVGGVTVQPFSVLPATVDGRATTYGAQDGLLTATTTGGPENGTPAPITLSTRPSIVGSTLDLTPHEIRMFGLPFPARDVLAEVKTSVATYPLQPLPAHLAYRGVEVLPQGLRISLGGRDIDFGRGMLAGTGCHA